MRLLSIFAGFVSGLGLCASAPGAVEFNRDIRPILSDRCFSCHGPDAASKKIQLRLDSETAMMADLGGRRAVVPGDPAKSVLIQRISHEKAALRMPPAYSPFKLSDREIELLKQWVTEGAQWQKHWSLNPPARPELPRVRDAAWPRNAVDHFVLSKLEREGLQPNPAIDKAGLLRRVSLDLTGLPPTLAELDAFLSDNAATAYERQVDRLLASPRYGERMAARWLDVARYADTNGYQTDGERSMWRWRDWVIRAFNSNMPFDRFTIEQIAGDLLPNPTRDQIIATGFNRNHRGNGEGGIVPEEYMVEYAADRLETMSTVWLGVTMGCSRCHNHKYDPLTQKDYYSLFAYFNNIPDRGRYFKFGNTPPFEPAPTPDQEQRLAQLESRLAEAKQRFDGMKTRMETGQREWQRSLAAARPVEWSVSDGLKLHVPLSGKQFDGTAAHDAGKASPFGYTNSFSISAWIYPTAASGSIVTRGKDAVEESGIVLALDNGKLRWDLAARWLDDALRVETKETISLHQWHHILATYSGTKLAEGIRIYIDGKEAPLNINLDELNQEFRSGEPWRIGGGGGSLYKGRIEDVRLYARALGAGEAEMQALRKPLHEVATMHGKAAQSKLHFAYLEDHADADVREAWKHYRDLRYQRDAYVASFPTVMVMREMAKPRETFLLLRGAYDKPGERVSRNVPAALHPLPGGAPANRLGLAQWLVDPANPLTARAIVNRFWQMYFGTGIVKTVEDLGAQGEWPSHPELLDWLATEFVRTGWDVKAIQKAIVMSATYQQSSRVSPDLVQRDPENRLLARGPRVRLPAETVRDQALAVSGLLKERIGGPSVKPYQPAGLWTELTGGEDYKRDAGDGLYRRSLYTFWKRTSPPPAMMNFDAAGRETCIVRENRTNTPLQALNLMNDVTYLEAARKLAERMMKEGGRAPSERIAYGYRLTTSRVPRPREIEVLLGNYRNRLDYYQTNPEAARMLLKQGDSPRDESLDASEVAAFANVASLILNLDETITKQ
ncbi:MAG: DUF1553 domain-containing protein [Acidobacteria bacterium]|nr:DUF1553 domain-containing protein [Acidobacteriota bacterium]